MTLSRKRKLKNDNQELQFEKKPRELKKFNKGKKKVDLLPIKAETGKIILQSYLEDDTSNVEEKEDVGLSITAVPLKKKTCIYSTEELIKRRKLFIQETKANIASIVSDILSNPEGNMKLFIKLRSMLDDTEYPECIMTVRKLVVASLGYLLVDIIPGYRIRPRTDKEKAVKLSKEVKSRTDFEDSLLNEYRLYLKFLEQCIKQRINPGNTSQAAIEGIKSLGEIAIRSLSDLYSSAFHFNYHSNITLTFVPIANNDKDPEVRKHCCKALCTLFGADKKGKATLETVKIMANVAKKQGSRRLKIEFINTLLTLRIKVVDYSMISGRKNKIEKKEKAKEMKKMSRNELRQLKKEKDLNMELKELDATEDYDERTKTNTEIVQQIFLIYFRILKNKSGKPTDCRVILPSVLEGLAKYAHLINIAFFGDLIKVLEQLVTTGSLTIRENLHCIYTVFKIISGEGDVINVDPNVFYKLVYNICDQLLLMKKKNSDDTMKVFLDCIDMMLIKRRKHVTLTTLCAFIKRLSSLALHLPNSKDVTALLHLVDRLLISNSATSRMFDIESMSLGDYDAEVEEPQHSKAIGAVLWDLHLLRRHFAPQLSKLASKQLHSAKL